jgi:hypothetical protein
MNYHEYAMAEFTLLIAAIGWLAGLLTSHMARCYKRQKLERALWAVGEPKERER